MTPGSVETTSKTVTCAANVLRSEANYFERYADAVAYAAYREQGWSTESVRSRAPIGTSSRTCPATFEEPRRPASDRVATGPRRRHPGAAVAQS
jgi:hypothetical protein